MELFFLPLSARRLDEPGVELCACSIWTDQRPVQGLAGLLDWRLGGRLSGLLRSGFASGGRGESLLVPGRPHLPFDKVLFCGLGPRGYFDEELFCGEVVRLVRTLESLRVRRCVVELPGRACDAIEHDRAVWLTRAAVGASAGHDAWWVVDPAHQQPPTALPPDAG